jgi:hypothetical protein
MVLKNKQITCSNPRLAILKNLPTYLDDLIFIHVSYHYLNSNNFKKINNDDDDDINLIAT